MYIGINNKIKIIIIMTGYVILFGLIGRLFNNNINNINNILINSLLIFVWLGLSRAITNKITII